MPENSDNSNQKYINNLARNTPVALVVGAAGFIGSHLAEGLLRKNIQVIGLDNLSTGSKENLERLINHKDFHLITQNSEDLKIALERLDYIFIAASPDWSLTNLVNLAKENRAKIAFLSDILLYEKEYSDKLNWYKRAEAEIARLSDENHLNTRVIRLGTVYGPRMDFSRNDPLVKLIRASLEDNLVNESSLEFSTRALYISDAVDLLLKSIFAGSTAFKIFDGVGDSVKVSEVRQVLLDPLWYENRDFNPSLLPPWTTPNLEKTKKLLNWEPKVKLVKALRETLSYFKDRDIKIKEEPLKIERPKLDQELWEEEKKRRLGEETKVEEPVSSLKHKKKHNLNFPTKQAATFFILVVLFLGLIFPLINFGFGAWCFRYNLQMASAELSQNNFDKSHTDIQSARECLNKTTNLANLLENINQFYHNDKFSYLNSLVMAGYQILDGSDQAIEGGRYLQKSLLGISGQQTGDQSFFINAELYFDSAENNFSKAEVRLGGRGFNLPIIDPSLELLKQRIGDYHHLANQAKLLSGYLPSMVGPNQKSYLLVLVNNYDLRPSGGVVEAVTRVNFDKGVIKDVVISHDQHLTQEPPAELKTDMGINQLTLKNATFNSDFPSSAEEIISLSGEKNIDGVVAIDLDGVASLLKSLGGVKVGDQIMTADKLIALSASDKLTEDDYGELLKELANKLLFVPNQNWISVLSTVDQATSQKRLAVYFKDHNLMSFAIDQNIAGTIKRQNSQSKNEDFLGLIESNVSDNLANYYVKENAELDTNVTADGVDQSLRVDFNNTSQSLDYKDRLKIYLPYGTKLNKLVWGEDEVPKTSFADFGRSVYSLVIELPPQSKQTLRVEYSPSISLTAAGNKLPYKLTIFKQLGSGDLLFTWNLKGSKTFNSSTQLSADQTWEIDP